MNRPAFNLRAPQRHHVTRGHFYVALKWAQPSIWSAAAAFVTIAAAPLACGQSAEDEGRIFTASQDAVVLIEAEVGNTTLRGTGFFIDPGGTVLTSYTVGGDSTALRVVYGSLVLPARRLIADARSSIAILKIDAETPSLTMGPFELPEAGSEVFAVGFPEGEPLRATAGEVEGIEARNQRGYFKMRHIRVNVDPLFGLGGAPILDNQARVVGIIISRVDDGTGCYALPIRAAEKVRSDFLRFGEVRAGWMGVELNLPAAPVGEYVAEVDLLQSNGPAAQAGLRKHDVVTQIGDFPIKQPGDILDASFFLTAGDEVPVRVRRDGEEFVVHVRPRENPSVARGPAALQAADAGAVLGEEDDSAAVRDR